jgi:hypothetical protein
MIDNGSKSWTLFTYKPEPYTTNWVVVGTKWNNAGPTKDERTAGCYESEQAAREASIKLQREYDKLREVLLNSAREVNRSE